MEKKDIIIIRDPKVAKLLGDETRRRILALLRYKEMTPSQLSILLGKSVSSIMHHLCVLEKNGLVYLLKKEVKGNIVEKWYKASAKKFIISYELTEKDMPETREIVRRIEDTVREFVDNLKAFGYDLDEVKREKLLDLVRRYVSLRRKVFEGVASRQISKVNADYFSYWLLLEILTSISLYRKEEFREIMDKLSKIL